MGVTWSRKWAALAAASLAHPPYGGVDLGTVNWGRSSPSDPSKAAAKKDRTKIKAARKQARRSK